MTALVDLLKLQRFSLDEKRRQAIDFENLIAKLTNDVARIDLIMEQEIEKARHQPELQRSLASFRKLTDERKQRLLTSIAGLQLELGALREEMKVSFSELKKTETVLAQRAERLRLHRERRENKAFDDANGRRLRYRQNLSMA